MSVSPTARTPMIDSRTAIKTADILSCGAIIEPKDISIERTHNYSETANMTKTTLFDTRCSGPASSIVS